MAPTAASHGRSHSLLLAQKLLSSKDGASPLTLVLDTLEQNAAPLLSEFASRAKAGRIKIVFVGFATVRKPRDADVLIKPRGKELTALRSDIAAAVNAGQPQRALIIIDSLNWLATRHPRSTSAFLSSIISPSASVVAVYHTDLPLVLDKTVNEYEPHPLTVLCHLATAIFRVSNLYQAIERKRARDRSQQEPEWGLKEGREGVLIGLNSKEHGDASDGLVFEMEMRRRSGRAVAEKFVLGKAKRNSGSSALSLLSDHPMFAPPSDQGNAAQGGEGDGDEMETTFKLGLTDKQRKDREGVVLPYFDAQTDVGGGEGGRILYDMGREDDFDDEEDEI